MLAICLALLFVMLLLGFFVLSFVRTVGSKQEQQTAIEAAALAAAKALARIVVEDDNVGFVALADYPPTGKATKAEDNYFLSVRGINTLIGTVRADMIVADRLKDPVMKELAKRDYRHAMIAKDKLLAQLERAAEQDGIGKDYDGQEVSPYLEARKAYRENAIRMSGAKASLDEPSLKLTLGCIRGVATNTRVPQPTSYAAVTPQQAEYRCYKAYENIKYNDYDFVFAAVGQNFRLVDPKRFRTDADDVPYFVPSIVKCEADEVFTESNAAGAKKRWKVHAVACAEPGSLQDVRPCPGALVISFPDGPPNPAQFNQPGALLTLGEIIAPPADLVQSPLRGDYPLTPLSDVTLPILTEKNPPFGQLVSLAIYDWVRRAGTNINIEALIAMLSQPLNISSNEGQAHVFEFAPSGSINYSVVSAAPELATSHKQIRAITGLALQNAIGKSYDIVLKDYVYQPGRVLGGIHAGEPVGEVPTPPTYQTQIGFDICPPAFADDSSMGNSLEEKAQALSNFPVGPGSGALRPTFKKSGVAAEIRFRAR
ncbi:MAG TPA: pilus assembly protein TadG-related protein [Candidatus Obscuribacterales bacterium]